MSVSRMMIGPDFFKYVNVYLRQAYSIEAVAQVAAGLEGSPETRIVAALRLLEAAEAYAEPLHFMPPDQEYEARCRAAARSELEAREIIAKATKGEGPPPRVSVCVTACEATGRGSSLDRAKKLFREWATIAAESWAAYEAKRLEETSWGPWAAKKEIRKPNSSEFLATVERRERNGTEVFFVSVERAVQVLCGTVEFVGFLPWLRDGKTRPIQPKPKQLRGDHGTFASKEHDSRGRVRKRGEKS